MLSCLFKCMSAPTQLALEVAVDIILTLQATPSPGAVSSSAQSSEVQSRHQQYFEGADARVCDERCRFFWFSLSVCCCCR